MQDYDNSVIDNAIINQKGVCAMAVRDHSLDGKIIEASRAEFLAHGYQKASLHKIAQQAGITTGALYTRYKNKDALFCSLVEGVLKDVGRQAQPVHDEYYAAQKTADPEQLLAAIRSEEQVYLDLLFDHYEECILFFCRSDGSSIQAMMDRMMALKARQTIDFLKKMARHDIDYDGVELILCEQFRYYRLILEKGFDKERAMRCMATVEEFLDAGWKSIFEKIL